MNKSILIEKQKNELYYNEFPHHLVVYHDVFHPSLLEEVAQITQGLTWFHSHYDSSKRQKPTGAVFTFVNAVGSSKQAEQIKLSKEKELIEFRAMLDEIDNTILEILNHDYPNLPLTTENHHEYRLQNLINWFMSHEVPLMHSDNGILSVLTPYVLNSLDYELFNSRGETDFIVPDQSHLISTLPRNGDFVVFSGQIQHRGNGCANDIRRYSYVSTYAHPKHFKDHKK